MIADHPLVLATNRPQTTDRSRVPSLWPKWVWLTLVAVIATDLIWIITPHASLSTNSWSSLASVGLCGTALVLLAHRCRLGPRTYTLITGFAITLAFWPALKLLNHLTMSIELPLADAVLASGDQILGLHWLSYIRWLDGYPTIVWAMSAVYGGLASYCCIIFLAVLICYGHVRAIEFTSLFVATAVFTIIVGPLFPAKGAMVFFAPDSDQFNFVSTNMGTYFWEPLSRIRMNDHLVLDIDNLPGLVAFPSFHTTMGMIGIYACRGHAALLIPSLSLNGLMIASTPLFGGHYFVDVIAGMITAVGAIYLYRTFRKQTDHIALCRSPLEESKLGKYLPGLAAQASWRRQ